MEFELTFSDEDVLKLQFISLIKNRYTNDALMELIDTEYKKLVFIDLKKTADFIASTEIISANILNPGVIE